MKSRSSRASPSTGPARPSAANVPGASNRARAWPVGGPSAITGAYRPSRASSTSLPMTATSAAPGAAAKRYENARERRSSAAAGAPAQPFPDRALRVDAQPPQRFVQLDRLAGLRRDVVQARQARLAAQLADQRPPAGPGGDQAQRG